MYITIPLLSALYLNVYVLIFKYDHGNEGLPLGAYLDTTWCFDNERFGLFPFTLHPPLSPSNQDTQSYDDGQDDEGYNYRYDHYRRLARTTDT